MKKWTEQEILEGGGTGDRRKGFSGEVTFEVSLIQPCTERWENLPSG